MAFCKECGTEVLGGSGFCHSCGTGIENTDKKAQEHPEPDNKFETQIRDKPVYGRVNFEDLPKGHIIDDRYEVTSKLGQGGFGAVYRVYDKKMKIDKALKVLPEAITCDREAMESLRAEAAIMVRLNNDAIVRVYDFQDKGPIKYIDMEFVDGRCLTDVKLDSPSKKLPESEVKAIAVKIAKGLSYAHSKNVIHKDIKPQNIILTETSTIKIMDFGISETVRSSMSRVENSSSSGTLVYMSPEQMKGMNVGREADVYSYGVLIYELLSGKTPFYKGDIPYQVVNEKPPLIDGVSNVMNAFLQKCLAKDYKERFRNFDEVQKALTGKIVVPFSEKTKALEGETEIPFSEITEALYVESKSKKPIFMISAIVIAVIVILFSILNNNKKTSKSTKVELYRKTVKVERPKKNIEKKPVIQKARLNVKVTPSDAIIKILNIVPAFSQGILLKPGEYHVSVSKKGYVTKKQWVELYEDQVKTLNVQIHLREKKIQKFTNGIGMTFVYIKPGSFYMGSNSSVSDKKSTDLETIRKGFYMQTTEVTQGQWFDVMGTKPWSGKQYVKENRNNPAVYISWNDTKKFIKKLNRKKGFSQYRLPTEAEWEFAARGGSNSKYCFGDNASQLGNYAWYDKNSWGSGEKYAHGVSLKKVNQLGLYDMHGNVWEWVEGWKGSNRVFRGGSWRNDAAYCESADRNNNIPGYMDDFLGFRLSRTP